jgi:CheY-like chemotaxis protein
MLIASLKLRFECRVLYATEGLAGIRMVVREQPDLVLRNLATRSMDGLTTTRPLKRDPSTAPIPVVAFSNYGRVLTALRMSLDAGCVCCLDKLLRIDESCEAIEAVLDLN